MSKRAKILSKSIKVGKRGKKVLEEFLAKGKVRSMAKKAIKASLEERKIIKSEFKKQLKKSLKEFKDLAEKEIRKILSKVTSSNKAKRRKKK